ncbi:hypothetical protein SprV_1002870700 [Sparganum proliferum]
MQKSLENAFQEESNGEVCDHPLSDSLQELNCRKAIFADDIHLWKVIKDPNDQKALKNNPRRLQTCSEKWLLDFSVQKCAVLPLRPIKFHSNDSRRAYHLEDSTLPAESSQNALSVRTQSNMKPALQCTEAASMVMGILYAIRRTFVTFDREDSEDSLRILDDFPDFHVICKHGTITVQPIYTIIDEQEKEGRSEHRALWDSTLYECVLHLSPANKPAFRPNRLVPYATLPFVEAALKYLVKVGVLLPVYFSAWTVKIVVVKKPNGSIRICANFSIDLNAALAQNCYPSPVPPDLSSLLNGGTCFDQLDLADAYLQIEVVPDSYELLTINTHRGLFQYTRLRFGVKAAPTLFQQTTNAMLSGIPGTAVHLDDIIVIVDHSPAELQDRYVSVAYPSRQVTYL